MARRKKIVSPNDENHPKAEEVKLDAPAEPEGSGKLAEPEIKPEAKNTEVKNAEEKSEKVVGASGKFKVIEVAGGYVLLNELGQRVSPVEEDAEKLLKICSRLDRLNQGRSV